MKDNLLSIQGVNGFKMTLDLSRAITNSGFPDTVKELEITEVNGASKPLVIDATGIGPMVVQVGANEGQTLEMDIPKISLSEMGLDNFL